jgi:hypothetical protein
VKKLGVMKKKKLGRDNKEINKTMVKDELLENSR